MKQRLPSSSEPRAFLERAEMTLRFGLSDAAAIPKWKRKKYPIPARLGVAIRVDGTVYENEPGEALHASVYLRVKDDPATPEAHRALLRQHQYESGFTVPTVTLPPVESKQHTSPCYECPFSRASIPGNLGGVSPDDWLRHGTRTAVLCHIHEAHKAGCVGTAIFRANLGQGEPNAIALRLPADTTRCFASEAEFREHHGPANQIFVALGLPPVYATADPERPFESNDNGFLLITIHPSRLTMDRADCRRFLTIGNHSSKSWTCYTTRISTATSWAAAI